MLLPFAQLVVLSLGAGLVRGAACIARGSTSTSSVSTSSSESTIASSMASKWNQVLAATSSSSTAAQPTGSVTVINPLGKGQDPAPVTWHNTSSGLDTYLFPDIDFAYGVYIRVSTNLSDVQYNPANEHSVFNFTDRIATEAPDLSQTADGRWVMYISSVSDNNIYVIQSSTSDPLSTWTASGRVEYNGTIVSGYDAHAVNLPDGRRYLSFAGTYNGGPAISLVQLQTVNTTVPGTPLAAILWPTESYEKEISSPIMEAPSSWVVNNNTLNLAYASNLYSDATYNTNLATASLTSDILLASSWTKSPSNPILSSTDSSKTYGPGSGGFFTGPDGEAWFAYGAFNDPDGFTGKANIRTVRAQKMGTDSEGRFEAVAPVNATRPIAGDSL